MAYKKYDGKNSMYDIMVRLYAFLVSLGRKEIGEVPELYRDDVAEYLKENY